MKQKMFFSSLANSQRLAILHIIFENQKTLSSTAKELNVTKQETHRNLNRLMNSNVIEKISKENFSFSVFGDMLIKNISDINFLSKHRKKFFSEHNFQEIPIKYIQRIGALEINEFISEFVAIL
jgi:predicted transcriptional regulator